jgi:hypothetical protein
MNFLVIIVVFAISLISLFFPFFERDSSRFAEAQTRRAAALVLQTHGGAVLHVSNQSAGRASVTVVPSGFLDAVIDLPDHFGPLGGAETEALEGPDVGGTPLWVVHSYWHEDGFSSMVLTWIENVETMGRGVTAVAVALKMQAHLIESGTMVAGSPLIGVVDGTDFVVLEADVTGRADPADPRNVPSWEGGTGLSPQVTIDLSGVPVTIPDGVPMRVTPLHD